MDTQSLSLYQLLITILVLVTALLLVFIGSAIRYLRIRIQYYRQQVAREIELIDQERSRISADLHDELGSGLSAVGLYMRQAAETFEPELMDKAINQLQIQRTKIRQISHDLVPQQLKTHGLLTALRELAEEMQVAGKPAIRLEGNMDGLAIRPPRAIHIYRIVRELVTNAVKHSGASIITIDLVRTPRFFCIEIRDNGRGFDSAAPAGDGNGMGLQNIQARVELLHAVIITVSKPDVGTSYTVRIPYESILPADGN
ncbi:MAG: hypothetical protein JO301_11320 [Chitinophagaceae bacterium]|nr:hypothetical protein [Chitinophagaceae bacterium]